jgi:hypothetical protein
MLFVTPMPNLNAVQITLPRVTRANPPPLYDGACSNFKMPSYIPNMMAALGTVRRRWGVSPPYRATMPSSFQISLKH